MLNFYKLLQQENGEKLLILSKYSIDVENDLYNSTVEIPLTKIEIDEIDNFGKKVLQRFASDIMAEQVHSDSFRNKPELTEAELAIDSLAAELRKKISDNVGLSEKVLFRSAGDKDLENFLLPPEAEATATQIGEVKSKRTRKSKTVDVVAVDPTPSAPIPATFAIMPEMVSAKPVEVAAAATPATFDDMLNDTPTPAPQVLTIDDLRSAIQGFMQKNGTEKAKVDIQTTKLVELFKPYGGTNALNFPKDKYAEVIEKIKNL